MSRFELACKLTLRDTETGEEVSLIDDDFHIEDEKVKDYDLKDTIVEDFKTILDANKKEGLKSNYSDFTIFVNNFHRIVEEVDEPTEQVPQLVEEFMESCEDHLAKLREIVEEDGDEPFFDYKGTIFTDEPPDEGTLLN
jgi:hypothetical protein